MRNLFNTKLKIIVVLAVLLTAVLSVMAGLTNRSIPELAVQGLLAPFRAAGTALTKICSGMKHWRRKTSP